MRIFFLVFAFFSITATANNTVWVHTVDQPLESIYKPIYKSLEDVNFYVVFEPNIGKNNSRFSERWGNEYNRSGLSQIRSMVFCNGWYANQVGNADPEMLSLCPLHITLIEKEGRSTVLFVRPSAIAKGSKAESIAIEIEDKVIMAITSATTSTVNSGKATAENKSK